MDFFKLIKKEGYLSLSFELNKKIGLSSNVLLTFLIQKYMYLSSNNLIDDKFYCKKNELEDKLALSSVEIDEIINRLCDYGLITCIFKKNRYFKINEQAIINCFEKDDSILLKNIDNGKKQNNRLSKRTLKLFYELYNKNLPLLTQKKLLEIIDNEQLICKAIEISAQYSPDHSSYIFKVLKNWQDNNISSLDDLNNSKEDNNSSNEKNIDKVITICEDITNCKNIISQLEASKLYDFLKKDFKKIEEVIIKTYENNNTKNELFSSILLENARMEYYKLCGYC